MRKNVYFIQRGSSGPIKIGATAGDPHVRLSELQIASPETLYLIGFFRGSEADMHERFEAHRISGEWFSPHEDILEFVRLNRSRGKHRGRRNQDSVIYFRVSEELAKLLLEEQQRVSLAAGAEVTKSAVIRAILEETLFPTRVRAKQI